MRGGVDDPPLVRAFDILHYSLGADRAYCAYQLIFVCRTRQRASADYNAAAGVYVHRRERRRSHQRQLQLFIDGCVDRPTRRGGLGLR